MKAKLFIIMAALVLVAAAAWAAPTPAEEEEEGGMMAAGMYSQSPFLDARVVSGDLPPVDERLPVEPFVLTPLDEVGKYGGTFTVFALDNLPWNELTEEPSRGPSPLRMTMDGDFLPDIAIDYDLSADYKSFTLKLREGMKWSDGSPFTSADFTFMVEDMGNHEDVDTWGYWFWPEFTISAPDDYTVVYNYSEPVLPTLVNFSIWTGSEWIMFHPKTYLEKWHIDYNDDAEELAKEEGYDTWFDAFNFHASRVPLNDSNKPTTQPWRPEIFDTTVRVYERNPYFHQVDTAGQQLPYVDEIVSSIVDRETYNLKIVAGEADVAWMFTTVDNFTLYKESESTSNYVVKPIPGITSSDAYYWFNLNHEDPVRRELYQNKEFRRALSIAIEREEINDLVFNGLGVPRQNTALANATYYDPAWGEAWAQYDPDRANQMLDSLGLDERNSAGIRLQSDGEPLVLNVEFPEWFRDVAVHELVKEYWREIGIDMRFKSIQTELQAQKRETTNWDLFASMENMPELYGFFDYDLVYGAPLWQTWWEANNAVEAGTASLSDYEGGVLPGEEPPDYIKDYYALGDQKPSILFGSPEFRAHMRTMYEVTADEVFSIGTVGMSPILFLSRPNIGNIPDQTAPWFEESLNFNYYAAQWFYR